jgi:hypothetical protein
MENKTKVFLVTVNWFRPICKLPVEPKREGMMREVEKLTI